MKRTPIILAFTLIAGILLGWRATTATPPTVTASDANTPQPSAGTPAAENPAPTPDEAAVRKLIEAFAKAANAHDAKAAAALWTESGEFTDIDGSVVRGRADLEKMYTETFKTSPKGKVEIRVESVRPLGKNLATSEGVIRFIPADGKEPEVTKYAALHVREGDGWLTASAREWVPDPTELIKLSDLEWLIGEWEAKRDDREVRTTYTWGDEKAYIQCRFKITDKGEVVASGTEIIAKDPTTGQIRAWLFDRSGTLAESVWSRDGNRWQVEVSGTTPDGSELGAVNALVPIGKDAFTWVSVDQLGRGATAAERRPAEGHASQEVTRFRDRTIIPEVHIMKSIHRASVWRALWRWRSRRGEASAFGRGGGRGGDAASTRPGRNSGLTAAGLHDPASGRASR